MCNTSGAQTMTTIPRNPRQQQSPKYRYDKTGAHKRPGSNTPKVSLYLPGTHVHEPTFSNRQPSKSSNAHELRPLENVVLAVGVTTSATLPSDSRLKSIRGVPVQMRRFSGLGALRHVARDASVQFWGWCPFLHAPMGCTGSRVSVPFALLLVVSTSREAPQSRGSSPARRGDVHQARGYKRHLVNRTRH